MREPSPVRAPASAGRCRARPEPGGGRGVGRGHQDLDSRPHLHRPCRGRTRSPDGVPVGGTGRPGGVSGDVAAVLEAVTPPVRGSGTRCRGRTRLVPVDQDPVVDRCSGSRRPGGIPPRLTALAAGSSRMSRMPSTTLVPGLTRGSSSNTGSSSPFMPWGAWSTRRTSGVHRCTTSSRTAVRARRTSDRLMVGSRERYSSSPVLTTGGNCTQTSPGGRGTWSMTG